MKQDMKCKLVIFVLCIAILFSTLVFPSNVLAVNYYNFSTFSEEDALNFVEEHGIDIPQKLLTSDELSSFTLDIILQSYYHPDIPFCFNYSETQRYAENIRMVVKSYLNIMGLSTVIARTNYTLQYNTVKDSNGNWVTSGGAFDNKWLFYNCYAYAINRAEPTAFYYIGDRMQYQPGNMSGIGSFDDCSTINELAEIVQADLITMGYSDVTLTSYIPSVTPSQELICVRMCLADYHFMRYDLDTNAWYHKPADTAILKYNSVPTNDVLWFGEFSSNNGEGVLSNIYDSEIVFIRYSKNQINVSSSVSSEKTINKYKDILCEINFDNLGIYDIELSSEFIIEYDFYNEDFDTLFSSTGRTINFTLDAISDTYYLRMSLLQDSNPEGNVNIEINPHTHTHLYTDDYVWETVTRHKCYCECGEYTTSAHVVRQGSFPSPEGYAICLLCRGRAFMGTLYDSVPNELPYTLNGSYILPNGTVVLVDEDVESYMNGSLVFYRGEIE